METGLSAFEKFGLAGLVIFCLFIALYRMHVDDTSKDNELSKQHDAERKSWHDDRLLIQQELMKLTIAFTELAAKLPNFCGERRYKPPKPPED